MMGKIGGFVKKYGWVLGILFLGGLFAGNLFFLSSPSSFERGKKGGEFQSERKDIPKLSQMKSPSVDGYGASIAREEKGQKDLCATSTANKTKRCASLPVEAWVLLMATYLFLMLFNLGITFDKRNTAQWFWEAVYTISALASWFVWDQCQANLWFPLNVMVLGTLVYLAYLYFFWERMKMKT